jgi:hypothetical protein
VIDLCRSIEKPNDLVSENAENKEDYANKHPKFDKTYLERKLQEL